MPFFSLDEVEGDDHENMIQLTINDDLLCIPR